MKVYQHRNGIYKKYELSDVSFFYFILTHDYYYYYRFAYSFII